MRTIEKTPPPLLGPRLRQLRLDKYLSLKELAEATGSSASAIHRYESGWDRFEIRTLRRLAAALGAELEIRLDPRNRPGDSLEDGEQVTAKAVFEAIAPLFWDIELSLDHLHEHPQWVLRRVLEYGDLQQVGLSRAYFGDVAIRRASQHRSVSSRVRRFWELVLDESETAR